MNNFTAVLLSEEKKCEICEIQFYGFLLKASIIFIKCLSLTRFWYKRVILINVYAEAMIQSMEVLRHVLAEETSESVVKRT